MKFHSRSKNKFANYPIKPWKYKRKNKRSFVKRLFRFFVFSFSIVFVLCLIVFVFWYRKNILKELPDVSSIKDMVFSQTTIIQDRHWTELYEYFSENRKYVKYGEISENMVNAIVAMEDQRYWTHWGLDPKGIIRAWLSRVFPFFGDPGGWSTLTQQLLKNLLLNKEWWIETTKEKVIRKFKEISLTSKLSDVLKSQIRKEMWKMSKDELNKEMKKESLELYLNYIFFGNHAYWVEAASNTYFGVAAKDLTVLQSAILASLPKGPSMYNPIKYKTRMMGELITLDSDWKKVVYSWWTIKFEVISKLSKVLKNANLESLSDNGSFTKFVKWLGSFSLFVDGENYKVEYSPGRKDAALSRMYEDGYIDQSELKNAFLQWLDYKFRKHSFDIKAPHFVWRVIEWLEEKYGTEMLQNWWLIVKTTLDYDIQKLAEKQILDNAKTLEYYGANNEAMVYVDSLNGDVLSYVGSVDYFSEDIEWQNDMIRSLRQVGSSIKPLIYAVWFLNLPLTLDTPIFDIPFKVGPNTPNNADGKFMWLMPLRKALAYSRNIPAVKMFLALWWENVAKPALRKMWLTSLRLDNDYWYSLALWAGEIEILELAMWYMHISARGKPAKINPILEVRSHDWAILYKKEVEYQKEVLTQWVAYLLWTILSDAWNMPPGWAAKYKTPGLLMWVKSWTSNMKTKSWESRARDGMMVWVTPSKVAIFWGGNTDGSPMYRHAYGGLVHSDPFRGFWADLLKNNYITSEPMKWIDVVNVMVSKISWKLASADVPSAFKIQTLATNAPASVDAGMSVVKLDRLCGGLLSPYTPENDIVNWYLIEPTSFMPNNMDLKDIKSWWLESTLMTGSDSSFTRKHNVIYNYWNIFVKNPEDVCTSRIPKVSDAVSAEIIKPIDWGSVTEKFSLQYSVSSDINLKNVLVSLDGDIVEQYNYSKKKNIVDIKSLDLNDFGLSNVLGKHELKIEIVDVQWYSNTDLISFNVVVEDKEPPALASNKMKTFLQDDWSYEVILLFEDNMSSVEWWKIFIWNTVITTFEWWFVSFNVEELWVVSFVVMDSAKNILKDEIDLSN